MSLVRRAGHRAALLGLSLALSLSAAVCAQAQAATEIGPAADGAGGRGRILLVLPFDNLTGQPSLEWMREAAADLLSSRFTSAGFAPMSRADRVYALDHLGLPGGFHPSRATALKLAETLDADSIIVGSYKTDGGEIVAEAQVVDVPHLRMSQPVTARGQMRAMISVFDSLAWKLTRQMDPGFSVAEETFLAAGSGLRLNAFEQYIRGITDSDQAERLRHQNAAVKLSPEFSPAWMALGREQYASKQYEQAAEAFAKVDRNGADALEAGFYRGLSLLFSGDYARAEEAFASVARVLPLAEVMNNQGVALARQGKDGTPLFRQATAADPNGADYHFNLAVSLKRRNHDAEALVEMTHCLRLHSNDSEAQALQKVWKASASASAGALDSGADEETGNRVDALERIERGFDAVAFRQAASVMDQMNEARVAALPPRERAQKLSARAKDYLDRGLLLEAERLDQAALAADPKAAAAHAGLAEIRERTGDDAAARKEARMALGFEPSADAFLVLGRLDLAAGHLSEASKEAGEALKLAPASRPARDLRQQIEARQIQKK